MRVEWREEGIVAGGWKIERGRRGEGRTGVGYVGGIVGKVEGIVIGGWKTE